MRARVLLACLIPGAFAVPLAFVACGGSVADPTNPLSSREPAPSSNQSPGSPGTDPAPSGTDSPPTSDQPGGTSGSDSPSSGGGLPLCIDPPSGEAACIACVENSCASQLHDVVAACGAFFACFQTCSCTDDNCISNCAGQATSDCVTAVTPLGNCEQNTCADLCSSSSTVSIDVGSDGGTSIQGSGTGGTVGTPSGGGCSALATCCATLSGAEAIACNDVLQIGNTSDCSGELASLNAGGICN
jgi:hypothetical protein